ncbi:membrane protein implicated in regulation of membrane protease activity [Neisseria sp. HSC-16F19]|nr:YqiJ family protein [Neisseria sp. HSC-16F19]MCP2041232.1 membrane protein implicated in regulation of membrane protease activity [Neisseria sp. HSC-16F19]
MWELINAPQNLIFGVAIALMLLLGLLEILSLLLGGVNDWIDGLLPDSLTEPAHAEIGVDAVDGGALIRFLSWLYVGKVPLLMLMVVFLAVFGLAGFILQGMVHSLSGHYLSAWLAVPAAWFASLPLVRAAAAGLYRILPKDETTAITQDELIGRIGTVTTGTARAGFAAEVRVRDQHGQQHYVMAEADGDDALPQGSTVLLVARQGNVFKVIANPNDKMVD